MSDLDPIAEEDEHYCKWHSDDDDCPKCGECRECGMCECGIDESESFLNGDDFYDAGEDDTMRDGYA